MSPVCGIFHKSITTDRQIEKPTDTQTTRLRELLKSAKKIFLTQPKNKLKKSDTYEGRKRSFFSLSKLRERKQIFAKPASAVR